MNSVLKKIIFNLAKLSRTDQYWVLKHLSPEHRTQFDNLQGTLLLQKARKFRHLTCPDIPCDNQIQLPKACHQLRQEDSLFIAIILEQGQFSWEKFFLHSCPHQDHIQQCLTTQVKTIKTATKYYLFEQWQKELSFHDQLETVHG